MAYQRVKSVVRHITSDTDEGTIIGVQLAGREILMTEAGYDKYVAAMSPTSPHRIGHTHCDDSIDVPTSFVKKHPGNRDIDPAWVLDYAGKEKVKAFLKMLDSKFTLS